MASSTFGGLVANLESLLGRRRTRGREEVAELDEDFKKVLRGLLDSLLVSEKATACLAENDAAIREKAALALEDLVRLHVCTTWDDAQNQDIGVLAWEVYFEVTLPILDIVSPGLEKNIAGWLGHDMKSPPLVYAILNRLRRTKAGRTSYNSVESVVITAILDSFMDSYTYGWECETTSEIFRKEAFLVNLLMEWNIAPFDREFIFNRVMSVPSDRYACLCFSESFLYYDPTNGPEQSVFASYMMDQDLVRLLAARVIEFAQATLRFPERRLVDDRLRTLVERVDEVFCSSELSVTERNYSKIDEYAFFQMHRSARKMEELSSRFPRFRAIILQRLQRQLDRLESCMKVNDCTTMDRIAICLQGLIAGAMSSGDFRASAGNTLIDSALAHLDRLDIDDPCPAVLRLISCIAAQDIGTEDLISALEVKGLGLDVTVRKWASFSRDLEALVQKYRSYPKVDSILRDKIDVAQLLSGVRAVSMSRGDQSFPYEMASPVISLVLNMYSRDGPDALSNPICVNLLARIQLNNSDVWSDKLRANHDSRRRTEILTFIVDLKCHASTHSLQPADCSPAEKDLTKEDCEVIVYRALPQVCRILKETVSVFGSSDAESSRVARAMRSMLIGLPHQSISFLHDVASPLFQTLLHSDLLATLGTWIEMGGQHANFALRAWLRLVVGFRKGARPLLVDRARFHFANLRRLHPSEKHFRVASDLLLAIANQYDCCHQLVSDDLSYIAWGYRRSDFVYWAGKLVEDIRLSVSSCSLEGATGIALARSIVLILRDVGVHSGFPKLITHILMEFVSPSYKMTDTYSRGETVYRGRWEDINTTTRAIQAFRSQAMEFILLHPYVLKHCPQSFNGADLLAVCIANVVIHWVVENSPIPAEIMVVANPLPSLVSLSDGERAEIAANLLENLHPSDSTLMDTVFRSVLRKPKLRLPLLHEDRSPVLLKYVLKEETVTSDQDLSKVLEAWASQCVWLKVGDINPLLRDFLRVIHELVAKDRIETAMDLLEVLVFNMMFAKERATMAENIDPFDNILDALTGEVGAPIHNRLPTQRIAEMSVVEFLLHIQQTRVRSHESMELAPAFERLLLNSPSAVYRLLLLLRRNCAVLDVRSLMNVMYGRWETMIQTGPLQLSTCFQLASGIEASIALGLYSFQNLISPLGVKAVRRGLTGVSPALVPLLMRLVSISRDTTSPEIRMLIERFGLGDESDVASRTVNLILAMTSVHVVPRLFKGDPLECFLPNDLIKRLYFEFLRGELMGARV